MVYNAQYFVNRIGEGVNEALNTCRFFLGVETEAFENADIHPEYVTTVEVAKKLTGIDCYVSLETHMKDLRRQAGGAARLRSIGKTEKRKEINTILKKYKFGKKDSCRIDIVVRPSDASMPPLLLAEAKLGVGNVKGIIQDIDRVLRLLKMYDQLGLLDTNPVYGAVLFHSSREDGDETGADEAAQDLLATVNAYLSSLKTANKNLHTKAGLLSSQADHQPVQGYWEQYGEGEDEGEYVFAKTSFTFSPGLVLLSHKADVEKAKF
tara:strand:+ start:1532 stop:2326 length:795 start_codon:yes stop_codon:yes gene_type:complete